MRYERKILIMAKPIVLCADSTCDLPKELAEKMERFKKMMGGAPKKEEPKKEEVKKEETK